MQSQTLHTSIGILDWETVTSQYDNENEIKPICNWRRKKIRPIREEEEYTISISYPFHQLQQNRTRMCKSTIT